MSHLSHFTNRLASIASQPNATRAPSYRTLLGEALAKPSSELDADQLVQITAAYLQNAVFSDQNSTGGGLVVGRQALTLFAHEIASAAQLHKSSGAESEMNDGSLPAIAEPDVRRRILEDALDKLQPRVLSFEEQASVLRSQLSSLLEAEEDWIEAARVLQAIPLDSGHRSVSDHYKLSVYMRIVRLLLEGDDPVGADVFLKRASLVIHNVPGAILTSSFASSADTSAAAASSEAKAESELEDPKVLGLQFKLCQARIYDAQRRFAEAAVRYHELSYIAEIDEVDRNMMLSAAVTASILSPAGPQRARTLATLIRDERTQSLPQYTILSKVFLDHIIRPHEIQAFEKLLAPHQVAKLAPTRAPAAAADASASATVSASASGDTDMAGTSTSSSRPASTRHAPSTVLDRAMIEHNLLSASRLYDNITLHGLGALLDLSSAGAEETARRMIQQGRLKAWIDQVGDLVEEGRPGGASASASVGGSGGVLYFVDQDRRGEAGTIAGGLAGATSGAPEAQSAAEVGDSAGGPEGAFGASSAMAEGENKYTKRWDRQIARTAGTLEEVCQRLNKAGFVC
ncbi:uncharacterized protein PFL1_02790 [Pseudozyma flocculosa PF-1]|uniref:COP9 signalosome complex subunit 4 n=2 Tax=Pseudozyma flocculosa TaxID=84751 RepID=A0A5C3F112_9BASI|nr:uncharacterized protein PFL1_02790 [Pseudozyma flocculosa PF-1]EPQ29571.1 hypothetical protein PFL1_02790 [Pseudozyma flocculosa PF-1]SPO38118.1 related to COP9 - signalosome complex subunit 4 [Pseudozyma flocculosa]